MIEVRFHGRGGQGVKLASRILGQSGFLSGLFAQDFALFGAERRGAPVVSFTRLSAEPIERRGNIERANLVVVMDDSLLKESPGQVFQGVEMATPVIVNAEVETFQHGLKDLPAADYRCVDMNRIAQEVLLGRAFVSAIAAAAAAKCVPAIQAEHLEDAVRTEIAEFGLASDLVNKNLQATYRAYDLAPAIALPATESDAEIVESSWQAVPYLGSAQFAGATIRHRGSAALRATGNWRTERPVIELAKCKRCFLCYLYCPEAAMRLDAENFPHVDYDHCKGCMICYEECPTDAISKRVEV